MGEKAPRLLRKGRRLAEAGQAGRALPQVGLLRLQYQSGQYAQLLADYKKVQDEIPEEARAEVMLLAANSQRQLGHTEEAEDTLSADHCKYPNPRRSQGRALSAADQCLQLRSGRTVGRGR